MTTLNKLEEMGLDPEDTIEKLEEKIKQHLNISFAEMIDHICNSFKNKIDDVVNEFQYIAPYDDYGKIINDKLKIKEFLLNDGSNKENWEFESLEPNADNQNLIEFVFKCVAVNDGENFKGFAFVNSSGKIKHSFASNED